MVDGPRALLDHLLNGLRGLNVGVFGVGRLHVKMFDKVAAATFCLSVGFSVGVALASWRWFPMEGDWGQIAEIPPTLLNYTALLLPWALALFYFLVRRFVFRQPFTE